MMDVLETAVADHVSGRAAHTRHHHSLLAAAEKRALVWLAERTPAAINSDHLSALGFLAMVALGVAFWASSRWPAAALSWVPVLLVLNWLGDSLDGTLARVRTMQRPRYGFYFDHVLDLAGTVSLCLGLAVSGLMHPLIAGGVLVGYLLLTAESFLATHARGIFNMSFLGWGPTELRILLAVGAVWLLANGKWISPFGVGPLRLFDVGGAIAIAGMGIAFVVLAARNAAALYKEETWW